MQRQAPTRLVVAVDNLFAFEFEASALRLAAEKDAKKLLGIKTGFCSEYQSFSHCGVVQRNDNLVCELRQLPAARRPHVRDRSSEFFQDWRGPLKRFFIAADHDR